MRGIYDSGKKNASYSRGKKNILCFSKRKKKAEIFREIEADLFKGKKQKIDWQRE